MNAKVTSRELFVVTVAVENLEQLILEKGDDLGKMINFEYNVSAHSLRGCFYVFVNTWL